MKLFKKYSDIKGLLRRFTVIHFRNFHIRIHWIVGPDTTKLFHTHPFNYISIILRGGYTETIFRNQKNIVIENKFLSVICRKGYVYHRIESVLPKTITLFFACGNFGWKAINRDNVKPVDGIFKRIIKENILYCKRQGGVWFIGSADKNKALNELRPSIHQALEIIN